jgi:hypothetical protein
MYSAASAYKIQFQGSIPSFQVGKLWKTKIEPKVKVFGWTTMHEKILTADNLEAWDAAQPNLPLVQSSSGECLPRPNQLPLHKGGPALALVMVWPVRDDLSMLH